MPKRLLPWGIAIFLALLPTYLIRFSIAGIPTTLLEMIFGLLFLWWVASRPDWQKIKHLRTGHPTLFWGGAGLIAAATISLFVASDVRVAAGLWKAYFVEPMVFFLICYTSLSIQDLKRCIAALSISAGFVAAYALVQYYFLPNGITVFGKTIWHIPNAFWRAEETRRATSVLGFPNAIGLFVAPLLPLFFWRILDLWHTRLQNTRRNLAGIIWYIFVLLASISAVILAQSSGALVAIVGAAALAGLLYRKTRIATAIVVVLAAIAIPLSPLRKPVADELLMRNTSGKIRIQMWRETLQQLETTPVLGNGLGSYQEAVAPYHTFKWAEIYLYPHTVLLNFWTETGLLGVLAFLILVVRCWLAAWRSPGPITYIVGASMVIIMIHGLVDVPYLKNDLAMVFWFLVAMVAVARQSLPKTVD